MERVTFLVEETSQRLPCLLNPETLVVRRVAGVRPRRSPGGQLAGAALADDPLLYTGGGVTELTLDLLFDTAIAGSSITTDDVRDLTGRLWNLAENAPSDGPYGCPPLVRFVWGKSWNIQGVVAAVAERLERFSAGGAPSRSWLRLRLLRVVEPAQPEPMPTSTQALASVPTLAEEVPEDQVMVHELVGGRRGEEAGEPTGERLDELATRYYGDPSLWRAIAAFNDLEDPLRVGAASQLRIPPRSAIRSEP